MAACLVIIFGDSAGAHNIVVVPASAILVVAPLANVPVFQNPVLSSPRIDALQAHVLDKEGKVEPSVARRFLSNVHYGACEGLDSLAALPLETKINLYESVAADDNPRNALYLDALNQEMGLTEAFYRREGQRAAAFFSPAHAHVLERKWQMSGNAGSFGAAMNKAILHPQATSAETKKQLLGFITKSFCDYTGQKEPRLEFFRDDPRLQGYADGSVVGINEAASNFSEDFLGLIMTNLHELDHGGQMELGMAYRDGRIGKSHPDYIPARVYNANLLTQSGYIPPENIAGHRAYEEQPAEIGANYAGNVAAYCANRTYGSGWKPQRTLDPALGLAA